MKHLPQEHGLDGLKAMEVLMVFQLRGRRVHGSKVYSGERRFLRSSGRLYSLWSVLMHPVEADLVLKSNLRGPGRTILF